MNQLTRGVGVIYIARPRKDFRGHSASRLSHGSSEPTINTIEKSFKDRIAVMAIQRMEKALEHEIDWEPIIRI